MPLDLRCPGCGRTLRIGDEHAGRQVRCPACQQITTAPGLSTTGRSLPGETAEQTWHMRTPEGSTYGPATWQEVRNWAAEGRVEADCELSQSAGGPWRRASEFLPGLEKAQAKTEVLTQPARYPWMNSAHAVEPGGLSQATAPAFSSLAGYQPPAIPGRYYVPHRGGLILVLGLLGFMISCPIFSLIAWVMGSHDLREIRAGRMDPSGEGLTQAGQIMGMVLSLLWIAGALLMLGLIALAAIFG
jgi:hypothetical protein